MESYIVGGAVRDYVLGRPAHDVDYVLVDATPNDIQNIVERGGRKVGLAFPIYIIDGCEYSVACRNRSARKINDPDNILNATLHDDLACRDFTINSMAMDSDKSIIDPYNGVQDVMNKVIRHTSSTCFIDDPVRILRAARQASVLGFSIHSSTLQLMKQAVDSGALIECTVNSADRIWKETEKALMASTPSTYFQLLDDVGALNVIFPELARMRNIPQPEEHHPEVWTLLHTYMVLDRAAELGATLDGRFAALFHDLGKGLTSAEAYPQHIGHESAGVEVIQDIQRRYPMPNSTYVLATVVAENHLRVHVSTSMSKPGKLVSLVKSIGGLKNDGGAFFEQVLLVCQSDAQGRLGLHDKDYPQADFLRNARQAIIGVKQDSAYKDLVISDVTGYHFAEALQILEINAAQRVLRELKYTSDTSKTRSKHTLIA